MHYARNGMVRDDYERDYALSVAFMDKAVDLIARQTKLALAAHKVEIDIAKLERQQTIDAHKRHLARNARKTWDQPHASQFEPDKHLKPDERSSADVRLPAQQSPDAGGDALP